MLADVGYWGDNGLSGTMVPSKVRGHRGWVGVGLVVGGLALYLAMFLALEPSIDVDTAAVMLVPVALAGWSFGVTGGVLIALLTLALHALLTGLVLHGGGGLDPDAFTSLPHALVTLAFGIVVGAFRRRDLQLQAALGRRMALERELRASERRLEQITENVLAGTYSIRKGRFTYVNAAFASTFGYRAEELLQRVAPQELVHPQDREGVERHVAELSRGGEVRRFRFRGLRSDGSVVPVEVLEQVVLLEGQRTVVGTLLDRTREEADEAAQRLQLTALEAAPVGIVVTDPDGVIEWANPHALGLTGYERDELIGHHTRMLGSGRQDRTFYRLLWTTVLAGRAWSGDLINRRKDGSEYREAMSITPVIGPDGAIEHLVAAKRDVTQQVRAQESIRALNADLSRQVQRLTTLRHIDAAITAGADLDAAVATFVEAARDGLDVDAIAVYVARGDELELVQEQGLREPLGSLRLPLDAGVVGRAVREGRTYVVRGGERVLGELAVERVPSLEREGLELVAAAPMQARGGLRGGLVVGYRSPVEVEPDWLEYLATVATQGAILIDNASLVADLASSNYELRAAYDATIEGWSHALDLRDRETEGHSRRVTELTLRLARSMGLAEEELVHVRRGSLLHDIGKMGVPDAILQKPGPLDDEEWAAMRRHTTYARDLLAPIRFLEPALDIPYAHHERWDGSGYPLGLSGEAIPLAARIFAVADVYDALTSDRPYRGAWSREDAVAHIREGAGSHFDPEVVRAFLALGEPG